MSRIVAVIIVALTIAVIVAPRANAAPLYASPTPVASGPGAQDAPSHGRFDWPMAWEDGASGLWHAVLGTAAETYDVAAGGGMQRHPAIDANRLIFEDDRNGDWDLYTTQVALPYLPAPVQVDVPFVVGPGDQLDPAVDGDTVVYESGAPNHRDIYARSLFTGVERRLTTDPGDQIDPAVDGDRVVYADKRNGNWDIYLFDLTTSKTTRLTTDPSAQTAPQLRHGVVVYQDHRNGNWDIYAYTLRTGKERRLTADRHDQKAPAIATERTVVYEDYRAGAPDIYLFDLATNVNKPVTDDPAAQTQPSVAYRFVTWTQAGSGDDDVYGCTLDYPYFTLSGPGSAPAYGSSVKIYGSLMFAGDTPATASIRILGAGLPRTVPVEWPSDSSMGAYSCSLRAVRKVTITAAYRGDRDHLPSQTEKVTVLPTAGLSTPAVRAVLVPNTQEYVHSLYASGTLRPQHKAGTKAVTLQVWRLPLNGAWEPVKSVRVPVHNVRGASAYSAKLLGRMSMGDSYKVCAVHADGDHARTGSAFSKVVHGP